MKPFGMMVLGVTVHFAIIHIFFQIGYFLCYTEGSLCQMTLGYSSFYATWRHVKRFCAIRVALLA